jgi:hypothetical protein
MARFAELHADPSVLEQGLKQAFAEVRSLPEPFQESLGRPRWDEPHLVRSGFFPWMEFGSGDRMFAGNARRSFAASFVEWPDGRTLIAVLDRGATSWERIRAGKGVDALIGALRRIDDEPDDVQVALASETHHGELGWLLSDGQRRRFWPAFPARFGLTEGRGLAEGAYLDALRRRPTRPDPTPPLR